MCYTYNMKHVPFKDAGPMKVNFKKATPMEPRKLETPEIPEHVIKVLCEAFSIMNAIRARDGTSRGLQLTQEYWDGLMDRIDSIVIQETGERAWLNAYLYKD